jgi:hypothetical protein
MTPIFNGVADSGSYPGVDFYRVDIDHVHDVVENVGGQTVRWFFSFSYASSVDGAWRTHWHSIYVPVDSCVHAQIPGFYAYQRGHKLGEIIGAHPAGFQVCKTVSQSE